MSPKLRLVVVLSVVYIDMLGIGLAFPVLPRLIEQFEGGDVSRAAYIYGALAAAYSLMQFLFAPLVGALSDRYGRRPVILLALAGMGVNYVVLAYAPSLWLFALGRMVAGAFGATFTAAGAYLADVTPPEKRAQSFGLIGAAFGFGFITGPGARRRARRRGPAVAVSRCGRLEPRGLRVRVLRAARVARGGESQGR